MQKINESFVRENLPVRDISGNKGSFGKLELIVGSEKYRGAAQLALEAALRFGAGYVTVTSAESVCSRLSAIFPEAIYRSVNGITEQLPLQAGSTVLIGCGCDISEELYRLTRRLLATPGGTLIIDADAINSLAAYSANPIELLRTAVREVVLLPHPLEFSRLTGIPVSDIEANREECARRYASESGTVVVLKGHATVVTDGERVLVNTSGSSALAKAGSGDTLAGALSSLAATRLASPLVLSAIAVFVHGMAADCLAEEYSEYGVTPSDLPKQMARGLALLSK